MSNMAESKVTGIIQSLSGLENDLDSLKSKVTEMKKQLFVKAQTEIDSLLDKTREMATNEAEVIINASKEKANAESVKIGQNGEARLSEITSKIDTNFDEAVRNVVSTVLKA
jgi:V/A-type H+-transporting ATPase subunit G/H